MTTLALESQKKTHFAELTTGVLQYLNAKLQLQD